MVAVGLIRMEGDRHPSRHHLEMVGRPTAVVAIRHIETRDGGRHLPAPSAVAGEDLSSDLADAARLHEWHAEGEDPMAVTEGVLLPKETRGRRADTQPLTSGEERTVAPWHHSIDHRRRRVEVAVPVAHLGNGGSTERR